MTECAAEECVAELGGGALLDFCVSELPPCGVLSAEDGSRIDDVIATVDVISVGLSPLGSCEGFVLVGPPCHKVSPQFTLRLRVELLSCSLSHYGVMTALRTWGKDCATVTAFGLLP